MSPAPAAAVLRLRVADPLLEPEAADAAATLPGAGIFHTAAWARVLHAAYGFRPRVLVAQDVAGVMRAAVPLTVLRPWPRRPRAVTQPFADECALLARDGASREFLHAAVLDHARRSGWLHWELRGAGAPAGTPSSTTYHGHQLTLHAASARCPAEAEPAVHRCVRQAERAGVTVEFGHDERFLRRFHALYVRTRRRHGAPPAPWRFFSALRSAVLATGHGFAAIAARGGEDLAAAVFLLSGERALYKYGASDPERHHLRPNHLVMARAAAHCARCGCSVLDLGRTSIGAEGLRRYKLSWGAAERRIDYTRLELSSGRALRAPDRARGRAAALLRLLPSPLFRALGAALHPHLA